jgi:hypothetical protein
VLISRVTKRKKVMRNNIFFKYYGLKNIFFKKKKKDAQNTKNGPKLFLKFFKLGLNRNPKNGQKIKISQLPNM